jgi:Raf kinase inhibitor-like YbhB/YbcL family protein
MDAKWFGIAAAALMAATAPASAFEISSSSFPADGTFPPKYIANIIGCTGQNVSPEVKWSNPPVGTKSFAVTMYDPDAPTGSGFWHWMAVNIPPDVTELKEGQASEGGKMPAGTIQARDDAGLSHYVGPCPPKGDAPHHYIITVYAVKVPKLEGIDSTSSGALVGFSLHYATVGKASMTYTYGR